MDTKKNIKDIEKSLLKDLGRMTKVLDAHLAQLPAEAMQKVAPVRSDMTRILKNIKDGDVDSINEIRDRYANTNR
jgi:hypothetical protein